MPRRTEPHATRWLWPAQESEYPRRLARLRPARVCPRCERLISSQLSVSDDKPSSIEIRMIPNRIRPRTANEYRVSGAEQFLGFRPIRFQEHGSAAQAKEAQRLASDSRRGLAC